MMKLKNPAIYYTGVVAYPDGTQALLVDFHKSEAGARGSRRSKRSRGSSPLALR